MRVLLLPLVLALAGCKFGPEKPSVGALALPASYAETTGSVGETDADAYWWLSFQDRTFDRLVQDGLAGNLDILQAQARIAAADANITAVSSSALPQVTGGLAEQGTREIGPMRSKDGPIYSASRSVSATWLLDFFGQVRSQAAAARAQRNAAEAAGDVTRLAVVSGLANAYVDARYFQERMQAAAATLESRRRTLQLTRELEAHGVASGLDVARAQEAVQAVEADGPLHEANYLRAVHRLSTLSGLPAATLRPDLERAAAQPIPHWNVSAGIPADLLRNRPDIRRAEQELAAAVADIGYAWSQLFPSVTLSGNITPSYVHTDLVNGKLTTWSFGPTLQLPIFDGGLRRANLKIARVKAEEKQAAWRAAVLAGVEEVENALVSYRRESIAMAALETRVRATHRTAGLSRASYRAGVLSLIEVLDVERSLYEAQASLALARRNAALQFVALNVAIGRGIRGPGRAKPDRVAAVACSSPPVAAVCAAAGVDGAPERPAASGPSAR